MARLKFSGPVDEYSPSLGLMFQAGEADYGDEVAPALLATGRFVKAAPEAAHEVVEDATRTWSTQPAAVVAEKEKE